jgi:hypothetical protein
MPKKRGPLPDTLTLYRVLPWLEEAGLGEPGHPLYVRTPQGSGRVDNPEHYQVLYASDSFAGAIAEAFGNFTTWTVELLQGPPSLPGSMRALATYAMGGKPILDLDDPAVLHERRLKPSAVVTRDRAVTQAWALEIFRERRWSGSRWWSYYKPEWGSCGVWNHEGLEVQAVVPLLKRADLVRQTAAEIVRLWQG